MIPTVIETETRRRDILWILALLLLLPGAVRAQADRGQTYDARLSGYEYPFPVRFHPVRTQQQVLEMAYMDVRPERANGRAVLLLHGKNFSGAYWERTIRALTAGGYRVIVPDQIGFGKSSKPERFQFSFQDLAAHTRGLLEALEVPRVSVVGHSMGGMLATRFALMYPGATEKLVLVNPIGLEDWKRLVPYRTIDASFEAELEATPESVRNYMRDNYFAGDWKPEYEPLVEVQAGWLRGPDRRRMAWISALTSDMVFTQPVLYEFPDLRQPVLLIIGQRDRTAIGKAWAPPEVKPKLGNYPELGRKAQAAIPQARLVAIDNAGHLPQVEAFERYRSALEEFLAAGGGPK
ncbi:MAG TPA: alpha/beta hydrolase [Thermoanaerobaculia bacterium]|nr:alpha/beta hydrolase [Thermoanaerobaculia bacterium]